MIYSGLSGNELYCVDKLGYTPGDLLIGNSVFSVGLLGGLRAGFRGLVGGEITDYTHMIAEGRRLSFERLEKEITDREGVGATGVTSELVFHSGNIEFLSVASALHGPEASDGRKFTTSSDGQEFYCQMDANYTPRKFVFGNVAYSIGVGQGIMGGLKQLKRGEIKEYTQIFNTTRNLALDRIVAEAKTVDANAVVGIETTILPFQSAGVQEMLMIGTSSHNPNLPAGDIVTSDLTCEEMWNLTNMGYIPQKLLLGTSVYSLGFIGGLKSFFKNMVKGEINELTTLIYEAREESIGKISAEAQKIGADDVVGIKTYVYALGGGLIEFLAIGTAIKKIGPSITTKSPQLLPQCIIRDKDTFYNSAEVSFGVDLNAQTR